jgi:hypothetical protein
MVRTEHPDERQTFKMSGCGWKRICVLDGPPRLIYFEDAGDGTEYLAPLDVLLDVLERKTPASELSRMITAQCRRLDYQSGRRNVTLRGITDKIPELIDAMSVIKDIRFWGPIGPGN